jgi:hypothetical protein
MSLFYNILFYIFLLLLTNYPRFKANLLRLENLENELLKAFAPSTPILLEL